jgi:hypothetical protein
LASSTTSSHVNEVGRSFYGVGHDGDFLADESVYPHTVREFLDSERAALDAWLATRTTLIEVGCMKGRHAEQALRAGKNYIGIDIEPSYVEAASTWLTCEERAGRYAKAFTLDATGLTSLRRMCPANILANSLIFLPFNSFGNMAQPLEVLNSLAEFGEAYLISTYDTSARTTEARQAYYAACNYDELSVSHSEAGVRFVARNGLNSVAYHPPHVFAMAEVARLPMAAYQFCKIGALYSSTRPVVADEHPLELTSLGVK